MPFGTAAKEQHLCIRQLGLQGPDNLQGQGVGPALSEVVRIIVCPQDLVDYGHALPASVQSAHDPNRGGMTRSVPRQPIGAARPGCRLHLEIYVYSVPPFLVR